MIKYCMIVLDFHCILIYDVKFFNALLLEVLLSSHESFFSALS